MKKYILILTLLLIALSTGACGRRVAATGWSGITASEDAVFLAAGTSITALDIQSGLEKWQFPDEPVKGVEFYSAPVLTPDGQLIAGGYDDVLYSIDPRTGAELWSFSAASDRYISTPLVTEKGIFASSADHFLYAVDFSGNQLWPPFETAEPIWAAPLYAESCDCLYLPSMDHVVYAIDPETGEELWESEDLGGPIVSKPAVSDDGLIFVSTFANQVVAISEEDHQVVWRFDTEDWAWASPLVDGDQLYVSDIAGKFYALDQKSGELLWQIQPGGAIVSPPLLLDEMIYLGTDQGAFVSVSREGTIQRNQQLEGKIYSSPAASGDLILLSTSDADQIVIAYNQNGSLVWDYPPEE